MEKNDIKIIAKHSDLQAHDIEKILEARFYPKAKEWQNFAELILLSLGIGFLLSGIVFFFAYNWEAMTGAVKLGILQTVLVVLTIGSVLPYFSLRIKNILLFSAAIFVGIILAVFSQIYQTDAQAYIYFLLWFFYTIAWSIVSKFSSLWLLSIALINAIFLCYFDSSMSFSISALLGVNLLIFFGLYWLQKGSNLYPQWLLNILVSIITFYSIYLSILILTNDDYLNTILVFGTSALLFWLGKKEHKLFYIGMSLLAIVAYVNLLITKLLNKDAGEIWFLMSIVIIASITLLIKFLLNLQKQWHYEK